MTDVKTDVVLYDVADGIATITLNRPDRLNAWTGGLARRYYDLLDEAAADDDVRVIIVTGAGRGFCAGADMDSLQGNDADRTPYVGRARASHLVPDHDPQADHRRDQRRVRRHRVLRGPDDAICGSPPPARSSRRRSSDAD